MPGFGRLRAEDPRDRHYPLRALLAAAEPTKPRRQWPMFRPVLDQGNEGTSLDPSGQCGTMGRAR